MCTTARLRAAAIACLLALSAGMLGATAAAQAGDPAQAPSPAPAGGTPEAGPAPTAVAASCAAGMIPVPAGTFLMGDGEAACGKTRREVTLTRDFLLAGREVTTGDYLALLQWALDQGYVTASAAWVRDNLDGGARQLVDLDDEDCEIQYDGAGRFLLRPSPSPRAKAAFPQGYDPASHPVIEVSWYGAAAYCDWLNLAAGLPRTYDHATSMHSNLH